MKMKVISLCALSVLCAATQAVTVPVIMSVSLTLIGLTRPASCFFGIFRRRMSPPIEETTAPPQTHPFRFPLMSGGMYNPFGGLGAGGMFFPGFNTPGIGIFNTRFPPQFNPSPQKPQLMPGSQTHSFPQQFTKQQGPGMPQFPQQQIPGMPQFPQQQMPQFPQQQIPGMPQFPQQQMPQFQQQMPSMHSNMKDFENAQDDAPGMNTEEAESFFTLLSETDESKCISRLVCEMGANPGSGGEFGQTIVEIIGSLTDFPDGSKVSEYNEVLNIGVAEGLSACLSKFSMCDEESYQLVKQSQLEDSQNE